MTKAADQGRPGTGPDAGQRAARHPLAHPRRIGWIGTVALAMGGSNQCLFLITALFVGQGDISGQGSAAVPLLLVGLLLSYAAAPGWTELVLMSPDRVGGIASACTAAFRPYSPILSALTGVCYWWGWVPTCGITAIMSATALQAWCLPSVPVPLIACAIVVAFTAVNLCGVAWVARLAVPFAAASATLAFVSALAPILSGTVDWTRAFDFHLTLPFPGWFGAVTSLMAGLYLIGFGAPAFEAAACHVGETVDPVRNVPRAMVASGLMAAVYFAVLPVVWLGGLGPAALGRDLVDVLGPTFAPVFGGLAKSAVIGFLTFNMFHGTLQPLAGAARTLAQISEDGLAPRFLAWRLSTDAPWAATLLTAAFAILFLLIGDPIWLIAAANFTYLIGIGLPSVAVWLLRRDAPEAERPYRAPRHCIGLGLAAAAAWGLSALLGFEQFGLPTIITGLLMAHSGAALYGWRMFEDRRRSGGAGFGQSLHLKLTGAMVLVLTLDAAGYILAVGALPPEDGVFMTALADIFVVVAMLTISVGLVLPGMIAHSANQVSAAAQRLAAGTVRDFVRAMEALGDGRLDEAHASIDIVPVVIHTRDELGSMARSFNALQSAIRQAALGLERARDGLSQSRQALMNSNAALAATVKDQERLAAELLAAKERAVYDSLHDDLTGLPNRTLFFDRLRAALGRGGGVGVPDFAVLFIDLDRFKVINDSLGHGAGDQLIVQVAARLRAVRGPERGRGGTAPDDMLARIGGDEFTMLVGGVGDERQALAAADRVLGALTAPFTLAGEVVHTGASVGVTLAAFGYEVAEDMLRDADLAMYRAKSLGKGRAELYRPTMHSLAKTRLHIENDLRHGLDRREFLLHYQPIVALSDARVLGFEALVRWRHPERGLICPGEFIPIAEETGFIVPLGRWILWEACAALAALTRSVVEGGLAPGMSVNLSPGQFAQPDIVDQVRAALVGTGAPPERLKLEITESGTIGDPDRAARILSELKGLGLKLSIDDFGTGYSSLSYLHRLPLDIVKIDRSFVSGLTLNAESRKIVNTILRLAEGLNMTVIAEGIETAAQADELLQLGCERGQGYYFSAPVTLAEAQAMLVAGLAGRGGTAGLRALLDRAGPAMPLLQAG